jgi:ElaA protein
MIEKRIEFLREQAPGCDIYTSVQAYRQAKYESLGFKPISEPYLDGRIVHVDMMKSKIASSLSVEFDHVP